MTRRARLSVPVANATVAGTLVAVIAAWAVVFQPPAPPGLAELAPRASRPFTDSLPGQRAASGQDPANCPALHCGADGKPLPGPTIGSAGAKQALGVPSNLQCYGWPDGSVTQTFDPQSPACVASWPGFAQGNGGATATGVTRDSVTVVVPDDRLDQRGWTALAAFFSNHYEMYGRRLRVVAYRPKTAVITPEGQAADAKAVAALRPFAATDRFYFYDTAGTETELARRGIHYFRAAAAVSSMTSSVADRFAGQIWSWYAEFDRGMKATGSFICRALAHHPPRGGNGERRIAVLRGTTKVGTPDVQPLVDQAASCRTPIRVVDYNASEALTMQGIFASPTLTTLMFGLSEDGVTTVIPSGAKEDLQALMNAADRAGYRPEWLLPGTPRVSDLGAKVISQNQLARTFGLDRDPVPRPRTMSMWYRAMAEVDPETARRIARADEVQTYLAADQAYTALSMLAAGIQAAGPRLTTASLRAGLLDADFPNPGAGQPPERLQHVRLDKDRYSFVEDYAIRWWSPGSKSQSDGGTGTWCYWQKGARFAPDNFPNDARDAEEGARC